MTASYKADELTAYARALLEKAGLDTAKASVTAHILLEGDLLGHDTHGLALLAPGGDIRDAGPPC